MVDPDDEVFEDEPKPDPISVTDQAVDGSGNGHEKVGLGCMKNSLGVVHILPNKNWLSKFIHYRGMHTYQDIFN